MFSWPSQYRREWHARSHNFSATAGDFWAQKSDKTSDTYAVLDSQGQSSPLRLSWGSSDGMLSEICLIQLWLLQQKYHRLDGLNKRHLYPTISKAGKSKVKVLFNLVPGENPLLGCLCTLCSHGRREIIPLVYPLLRHSSHSWGPHSLSELLAKTPPITLAIMVSTYEFGGDPNIQSIAKSWHHMHNS